MEPILTFIRSGYIARSYRKIDQVLSWCQILSVGFFSVGYAGDGLMRFWLCTYMLLLCQS